MTILFCLLLGVVAGFATCWLLVHQPKVAALAAGAATAQQQLTELERAHTAAKAAADVQQQTAAIALHSLRQELGEINTRWQDCTHQYNRMNTELSGSQARLQAANHLLEEKTTEHNELKADYRELQQRHDDHCQELATEKAGNKALMEKLETHTAEMETMGKKFNTEFENIASRILETKTEKFTKLNTDNLRSILEPLGQNINEFKKKVEQVYTEEAKERFSLGEKVKELALLNQQISDEARNLTKALKGEAKTVGCWGEMILENILERSGLKKGQEYFLEHELMGTDGKAMRSDAEGKKMRPDAVVKYPDNRNVIIDSKVSLNAFTRWVAAVEADEQKLALACHVADVKNHIVSLSTKGYDDYHHSLDFVMLFIPSEPAYNAALQHDPELWNYAYDKRILLLCPTNLITSLKLIVDLWKREYQNQHATAIADRGAKLYDKFVGFVSNLQEVGDCLSSAQHKYNDAFRQLSTGDGNLVAQATLLKKLGVKNKKDLKPELVMTAELSGVAE